MISRRKVLTTAVIVPVAAVIPNLPAMASSDSSTLKHVVMYLVDNNDNQIDNSELVCHDIPIETVKSFLYKPPHNSKQRRAVTINGNTHITAP